MKKFVKFITSIAVVCGAVAGGIYAYRKFFAPDPFADDFEDDFDEDVDLTDENETSKRGYVSLTPEEPKDEDKAEEAEDQEAETKAQTSSEETAEK